MSAREQRAGRGEFSTHIQLSARERTSGLNIWAEMTHMFERVRMGKRKLLGEG